jgi:hypothetical protein
MAWNVAPISAMRQASSRQYCGGEGLEKCSLNQASYPNHEALPSFFRVLPWQAARALGLSANRHWDRIRPRQKNL